MSELALGPPGADKIAIVGSAPASVQLAPYRDMSWAIWGVSPGAYGAAARKDVWFELHRWEPQEPGFPADPHAKGWFSPEYVRFIELFPGPVFMSQPIPSVANCVLYPYQSMIAKYGPYHFQSTMSWMLAYAIEQRPKAIGLWGVDCAAPEEWAHQRPGVQHFLGLAKSLGIEVYLPLESDLLQPSTMYGISEMNPRHAKLTARMKELQGRLTAHEQQQAFHGQQALFLKGAVDNLKYVMDQWIDDLNPDIALAISRSVALSQIPDPLTIMKTGAWPDLAMPNREPHELVLRREDGAPKSNGHDAMNGPDAEQGVVRPGEPTYQGRGDAA